MIIDDILRANQKVQCSSPRDEEETTRMKEIDNKERASFPFRKARCDKIRVIRTGLVRENIQNFYLITSLGIDDSTSNNDKTLHWHSLTV